MQALRQLQVATACWHFNSSKGLVESTRHGCGFDGAWLWGRMYAECSATASLQQLYLLLQVRTMHALDHRNVLKFYAW